MSKFYTNRGDQGSTDSLGGSRLSKSHPRIRAVGTLDEASAALGLARAQAMNTEMNQVVKAIQMDLYRLMTLVMLEEPNPDRFPDLEFERIKWIEETTDHYGSMVERPKSFILPGETLPSATFSLARTVIRRAERVLVDLKLKDLLVSETALPYLNRLSSLCFVFELFTSQHPSTASGTHS